MNETGEEGRVGREVWEKQVEGEKTYQFLPPPNIYIYSGFSRSYARYVLSLYRKDAEPFLGNG